MNQNNENGILALVVLSDTRPKVHIIVPEEYVFGLDECQAELKTYGVSKTHSHLIYWKRDFLNDNLVPTADEEPNFYLPTRADFPPPAQIDSACYNAKVKNFYKTTKFEEAKRYRDTFRPVLPVGYYEERNNNRPTPPNVPPPRAEQNDTENGNMRDNNTPAAQIVLPRHEERNETVNATALNVANIGIENGANAANAVEHDDEIRNPENVSTPNLEFVNVGVDTKPVLLPVEMDEDDVMALNELIDAEDVAIVENVSIDPLLENEQGSADGTSGIEANVSANSEDIIVDNAQMNNNDGANGVEHVTEIIGEDIEITFPVGQMFKPSVHTIPMATKANDLLSGNMLYEAILDRNDAEAERHYLVKVGDGFQSVKLKSTVVDFLRRLNIERRADTSVDKAFVKGLVIAVFSVHTVKSNPILNPDLVTFIRDLFSIRVGRNAVRESSFAALLFDACNEVRQMKKR